MILVGGAVLLVDRLTKLWVLNNIPLYGAWAPIPALEPYFRIIHTTNTGAAFGLFRGGGPVLMVIRAVAVLAILFYGYRLERAPLGVYAALGLILGGAAGNLWDGLAYGSVIDFLDFRLNERLAWPTFNVADTCVVAGVAVLVIILWRLERHPHTMGSPT
jgi:signal peptidase II